MTKNFKKYFEYFLFVLINIGLLAPMLKVYNFLFTVFSVKLSIMFFNMDSSTIANAHSLKEFYDIVDYEPFVFITTTIFCFLIIILKPFIFPILYLCKTQLPHIHIFF